MEDKTGFSTAAVDLNFANGRSRIVNLIVDISIFYLLYILTIKYAYAAADIDIEANPLLDVTLVLLLYFLLYTVTEFLFQKTPGKFLSRTKVVSLTGEKPTFKAIFVRTCCRLIPCEAFSFLFLDYGIHDKFSNTRVIYG